MIVSIIGAGGHVGIPFSLVCSRPDNIVYGIDLSQERVSQLNRGEMPFIEEGGQEQLKKYVGSNLFFTTEYDSLKKSDIIAIMIGTPVDDEGNPRIDDIMELADTIGTAIAENIKSGGTKAIILRSTVAPGTTRLFKKRLFNKINYYGGVPMLQIKNRVDVYFIPERVAQGKGLVETTKHHWMIGVDPDEEGVGVHAKLWEFIKTLGVVYKFMPYEAAEIGKLMTNMYRYVNFAFANEMYMVCKQYDVDAFEMIEDFNEGYERLDVPKPGPNVGGPCLFKDGKFLTTKFAFPELISTAFHINESMPEFVYDQMMIKAARVGKTIDRVLILGAAFKAESDDIRNSLSYKFKKICKRHGLKVTMYDPYVEGMIQARTHLLVSGVDAVVVMTPHKVFDKEWFQWHLPMMSPGVITYNPWKE